VKNFSQSFSVDVSLVRVPMLPAFPADLGGLVALHQYLCRKVQPKPSRRMKESLA